MTDFYIRLPPELIDYIISTYEDSTTDRASRIVLAMMMPKSEATVAREWIVKSTRYDGLGEGTMTVNGVNYRKVWIPA